MRQACLLALCAAAVAGEPALLGGSAVCTGYGAQLEESILLLPATQAITYPGSEHWKLYKSFLLHVMTAFRPRATWVMMTVSSWLMAFAAEAERWVDTLWSVTPALAAADASSGSGSGSNSNSSRSSSNIQSSSNGSCVGCSFRSNGSRVANGAVIVASANGTAVASSHGGLLQLSHELAVPRRPSLAPYAPPSCLHHVHALLMQRLDPRPASFIRQPPEGRSNGLVLLSGGDRIAALSESVVENHAEFARRHGYTYWWHRGSLVAERGWQPYWHKVAMLRAAARHFRSRNVTGFVWIDDDIVLTNHAGTDMLQHALRHHRTASVLVTRDPSTAATLNTGIVIVRNDAGGREVLDELWARATAPRPDGVSLAFDAQSRCLHEQQALQEMVVSGEWAPRIAVLGQRDAAPLAGEREPFNLNTFLRWSHWNAERSEQLRFDADAHGSSWLQGDFAGHCSGLSPLRRALCVAVLVGAVER